MARIYVLYVTFNWLYVNREFVYDSLEEASQALVVAQRLGFVEYACLIEE